MIDRGAVGRKNRMFWPKEIWGKYAKDLADFKDPANEKAAVQCLNHMVTDALRHGEHALKYMALLRDPHYFNFCAIPQVMAFGTLSLCYNNPQVFKGTSSLSLGPGYLYRPPGDPLPASIHSPRLQRFDSPTFETLYLCYNNPQAFEGSSLPSSVGPCAYIDTLCLHRIAFELSYVSRGSTGSARTEPHWLHESLTAGWHSYRV